MLKIKTVKRQFQLWTAYVDGGKLLFAHAGTEEAAIRRLTKILEKKYGPDILGNPSKRKHRGSTY